MMRDGVAQVWEDLSKTTDCENLLQNSSQLSELFTVLASSKFISQQFQRKSRLLGELIESGDLERPYLRDELSQRLAKMISEIEDEETLAREIRIFRQREMVRLGWRDLTGKAPLKEVVETLSELAEAAVSQGLERLYQWHCEQWGTPLDSSGQPQRLVVLGMGKLGAWELNFSSDIDLIFTYPEEGETVGGKRQITHQQFFVKLGQRLIKLIDQNNAYGFVFRVDMRLRPFGDASPLAISFDAMEHYYQTHGREWERYAMIKARPIAGDTDACAELMERIRPFIYRKYIDFGVFESLREMKAMIARESAKRGMDRNVKLGEGGIREVEFLGQAFQLIHGGREPVLQKRRILTVLEALRGLEMLPDFVVEELNAAYDFLRRVEHRLQAWADQQTQLLPNEGDEMGMARIAFTMGYDDWDSFIEGLRFHTRKVHQHFEQVLAAPQSEHEDSEESHWVAIWDGSIDLDAAIDTLKQSGFVNPQQSYELIRGLAESRVVQQISATARQRLDHLIPLLLGSISQCENSDESLQRILNIIEKIARRSAYISLLVENPLALSQLVKLCSRSLWIADTIADNPILLDELLDPRTLYTPPSREELHNQLSNYLIHLDADDQEGQMELLRRFKMAAVLRVAAADLMDAESLMVVSDHLTEIAEIVVEASLDIAWRQMVSKNGEPANKKRGLGVIGYGKMGGLELGYGSDLDMVMICHPDSGEQTTGKRPIGETMFNMRLGQRLNHIIDTRMPSGRLYEVDSRLRPNGNSGPLVSPITMFQHYLEKSAWIWELQALVRARFVAGDADLHRQFDEIRVQILGRERDREKLLAEVVEMREKMRPSLSKGESGGKSDKFDLKQDRGGIADIEFMVQYGVLGWAHTHPKLLQWSDNIRLLETMSQCDILSSDEAQLLADAYRQYRAFAHRLSLQQLVAVVDGDEFNTIREGVIQVWQRLMRVGE
ncbi:MAG: bifunctional [glutamate--ammonia ligase]-adenylyl-L-tyrosine phosphorylase/[glutamate--ammonia-ligase] adenylyltransferase [Gammaproteobacteria bacterium]|nr:bifunctional [glutamate--ammonia ligase]-adenylyl-L-tyrosine phosphorylase/[glutamate--ammonia-ligase] adenylyltransferase [Gammaproteobacteria bacterium]